MEKLEKKYKEDLKVYLYWEKELNRTIEKYQLAIEIGDKENSDRLDRRIEAIDNKLDRILTTACKAYSIKISEFLDNL